MTLYWFIMVNHLNCRCTLAKLPPKSFSNLEIFEDRKIYCDFLQMFVESRSEELFVVRERFLSIIFSKKFFGEPISFAQKTEQYPVNSIIFFRERLFLPI